MIPLLTALLFYGCISSTDFGVFWACVTYALCVGISLWGEQ